ncbi:hypothetical protein LF1_37060 [Rubripirellula obstinata]|uniref:Uncharacterized protein n=1 Tax=Rubripirellula obstinata TaxID=406547 RepID=A0A5B1CLK1_9BACT|nr:hypothetical protein LF1_37060 [Rubripirellula obstinata]
MQGKSKDSEDEKQEGKSNKDSTSEKFTTEPQRDTESFLEVETLCSSVTLWFHQKSVQR